MISSEGNKKGVIRLRKLHGPQQIMYIYIESEINNIY